MQAYHKRLFSDDDETRWAASRLVRSVVLRLMRDGTSGSMPQGRGPSGSKWAVFFPRDDARCSHSPLR